MKKYRSKPIQYKRNGDKYFKDKNYIGALYWYNLGLTKNPYNIKLKICKANTLFNLLNIIEALQNYYEAIKQAKKLKVFHLLINKINQGEYIDFKKFNVRLHKQHNLKIKEEAIPQIINYIKQKNYENYWTKQYNIFKKHFKIKPSNNINEIIDDFIMKYGPNTQNYIHWFHQMCLEKNYYIDLFQIDRLIQERKKYWNEVYYNNPNMMFYINIIDKMTGEEFEKIIKQIFQKQGYNARLTKKTKDQGGDLIAYNPYESIAIQCKRWKQTVRVDAIREAHTAKDIYKTNRAMVITNSYFTDDAIKLAEKLHIELWDRNRLIQEIMKNIVVS
jgi:Holliday junction resolvase